MKQSAAMKELNRLLIANARMSHQLAQLAGMNDAAFQLLYALADLDGICCQSDLCIVTALPKQTVHSAIRQLEQEGCLTLEKGIGRRRMVNLTDQGRQLVEEKVAAVVRAEEAALASLSRAEQRLLISLLGRYNDKLAQEAEKM